MGLEQIGSPKKIENIKRKSQKPDFFSDALDWKIFRAAKVPGPGHYDLNASSGSLYGGRWGRCKPSSYLDMAEKNGRSTPGPGAYNVLDAVKNMEFGSHGGKFNMSKPKSYLEWIQLKGRSTPAPNAYNLPDLGKPTGGKFNNSKSKTEVDWQILRASQMPAPGQYGAPDLPGPSGGKFNNSKAKTDLDWVVWRSSKLPGPGHYDVSAHEPPLAGGKFNQSRAKSDVEWSIYRAARIPAPGQYDTNRAQSYLAKNAPKFSFAGRPGPATMPAPYSRPATSFDVTMTSRRSMDLTIDPDDGELSPPESPLRSPTKALSPERPQSTEHRLAMEQQHVDRMKRAFARSSMKRRQKDMIGFGQSFFM